MGSKIVILGKNYSTTLGVVRSLGEHGYEVDVFFISSSLDAGRIISSSKYVRELTQHINRNDQNIVTKLVNKYSETNIRPVLLPTDDYSASVIDLNHDKLSDYFILPGSRENSKGSIFNLMDKSIQAHYAEKYDLIVAKAWTISFQDGSYIIPNNVVYPCFYKPLISVEGGKDGMKKCNDEAELIMELEKVKNSKRVFTVLVQEYLDIEEEYSISGICFGKEVFLPATLRKLRVCQSHRGTTISGIIEPMSKLGNYQNRLTEMLSSLNLYSIIDIELFRCGDKLYFNEINFRTSAVCYGAVAGGANIPALFIEAMISGEFETPDVQMQYGKTFLCEKAAWDDFIDECMTRRVLKELYKNSDFYIIRNDEDPKPEKLFNKYIFTIKRNRYLKRRLRRLLGR